MMWENCHLEVDKAWCTASDFGEGENGAYHTCQFLAVVCDLEICLKFVLRLYYLSLLLSNNMGLQCYCTVCWYKIIQPLVEFQPYKIKKTAW